MEMKQIYEIVNTVSQEVLGESALVQEDLGNIVDIGTAVFDNNSFDKFVRSLVDHIGRVVFVDRVYRGRVPSIVRDGWEYGAVLEKLACKLPEAQETSPGSFSPARLTIRTYSSLRSLPRISTTRR